MRRKHRLKELTIKDNFMFGAVMMDEENCKGLLERVLEIPIERVEVSREKSIVYHPEYKGVRLDVYAKDEHQSHYNVEMHVERKAALGKRSRYYQSQMDMELLLSGEDYSELPNTYVIFICDFDPFGEEKYRYVFEMQCKESKHTNVKADLAESEEAFDDPYVEQLQKFIRKVKRSREMEERFMIFEEMLKEEREEGREEGRSVLKETLLLCLQSFGDIPDEVLEQIQAQQDMEVLKNWMQTAFQSKTLEEFVQKM